MFGSDHVSRRCTLYAIQIATAIGKGRRKKLLQKKRWLNNGLAWFIAQTNVSVECGGGNGGDWMQCVSVKMSISFKYLALFFDCGLSILYCGLLICPFIMILARCTSFFVCRSACYANLQSRACIAHNDPLSRSPLEVENLRCTSLVFRGQLLFYSLFPCAILF